MPKTDKRAPLVSLFIVVALAASAVTLGLYLHQSRGGKAGRIETPAPAQSQPASPAAQDQPAPAPARPPAQDQEQWRGVYQGETKIGWSYSRLQPVAGGFKVWNKSKIKMKLLDQAQEISINLQGKLDPNYAIDEIDVETAFTGGSLKARGHREGNVLKLEIDAGGEKRKADLAFDKPPTMEMQWLLRERMKTAKIGAAMTFSNFEPFSQSNIDVLVTVVGEEDLELGGQTYPCLKAEITMLEQVQLSWFRKSDGQLLKEDSPSFGMITLLEDRETALKVDWDKAGELDLLSSLVVKSDPPIKLPRTATLLKARLEGAPLQSFQLDAPGRQTAAGNVVTVTVEPGLPASGYALPLKTSLPDKAAELAPWLGPSLHIESDSDKIKAAAQEALAGAGDAATAVTNLLAWMKREIEPSLIRTFPSALETLSTKRGACTEHAVLFTALARAAGVPARPVAGIVYSREMIIEGFYYHAWVEVWMADATGQGGWVSVDPTFQQVPADATHIRLVAGGLDQMIKLAAVMGKLSVVVEEVK